MAWDVSLHVYGEKFKPSKVSFPFSYASDVGEVGIRGKFKGIPTPFGHATIHAPETNAYGRPISVVCEIGLNLLPELKAAGATEFVLWVLREYEVQCNEELKPDEIALIARLGCSLCYSAYQVEESDNS